MSFNIIDLVKDQLTDQVMGQLGNVLGGSQEQNESAISSAIPGLLGGLAKVGATEKGAGALFNMVRDQDGGILDNLGDMLGGNQQSSMMEMGTKALGSLFGNSGLGNLVGAISGFSGASKSGTSSMLGLLAPMVFGVIKRKLLGGGSGLSVSSLMGMFNDQKDNVAGAMPSGFSDALDSSGFNKIDFSLADFAGNAVDNVSDFAGDVAGTVSNAAGNVADGVANVAGNVSDSVANAADSVADGVSNVAGNVDHAAREAAAGGKSLLSKLIPIALLIGAALLAYNFFIKGDDATKTEQVQLDAGQINTQLTESFGALTTGFNGIKDAATAQAALPALTKATDKIGSLAGMLNKLPEAARAPVIKMVQGRLPELLALMKKLSDIPGVEAVIKPVVENLGKNLAMFK